MSNESKNSESKHELEKSYSSDVPIESGESGSPLVLDLPDGQKIMVGQLDPGTIIEVATWRGTGRPDSRTNRLMLGVASDGSVAAEQSSVEAPEGKNHIKTGVNRELLHPTRTREEQAEVKKARRRPFASKGRIALQSLMTVGIVAGVIALAGVLGFKFEHPHSGASTALGSARSAVVLVHRSHSYHVGDKVVAAIQPHKSSPVLGLISAVSGDNILISSKAGSQQGTQQRVSGTAVIIIPGIGFLLNAVGL